MRRIVTAGVVVAALQAAVLAAEVNFATKPTAAKVGEAVKITFAVSVPTDVEVAVLDLDGKVVRHLAAGVLGGEKAPPAPLEPSLAQVLTWDGKDDFGRPAGAGPYTVRVRAGTGATFGRLIGGDPYTFGAVNSIAADEDGNVYILGFAGLLNQRHMTLRVFDTEGRYLREILPFPADLPPAAMKDVARWDAERRTFRPRNLKNLNPDFYGGGRGGALKMVSASKAHGVVLTDGTRLYTLETTGAVRGEQLITQVMWPKKLIPWGSAPNSGGGPVHLAASPDGKYAYLAGVFTSKTRYGHQLNPAIPPGRVYRARLDGADTMKEFVTVEVAHTGGVGGAWTKGMGYGFRPRGPVHGVTVDRAGRVYVCDREHARIAVYGEAGKMVGEIPIEHPDQVAVHPRTGAVYVMQRDRVAYGQWHAMVFKFGRIGSGVKPVASHKFGPQTANPQMALSVAKGKTVVWAAGVRGGLAALEDTGLAFEPFETHFKPRPGAQRDWNRIAVDYDRDELYVSDGAIQVWRYDGRTGDGAVLTKNGKPFLVNDLTVGYDGLLYTRVSNKWIGKSSEYSGPFWRLTRDLEPAPYSGTGSHVLANYIYSRYGIGYAERGIGHAPNGNVYLSWMYGGWVKYSVTGFGPDGKPLEGKYQVGGCAEANHKAGTPKDLNSAIIGPVSAANGGIQVDLAGNIYLGMRVWPKGMPLPEGFAKDPGYQWTVGSVLKFTPAGGAVASKGSWGSDPFGGYERKPDARGLEMQVLPKKVEMFVEGAVAAYTGLAPFSHAGFGGNSCCVCRVPRFDIDRYGRLAMPNAITNSVLLVDNAGNRILEFGRYGNFDSQFVDPSGDGKPRVAVPAIPLTWPTGAGFSEKHIYVNDTYSRRAVRVDLTRAVEETCAIE